jgi:hypothetical protein
MRRCYYYPHSMDVIGQTWVRPSISIGKVKLSTLHAAHNTDEGREDGASITTYLTPSLLSSLTELSLRFRCRPLDNGDVAFHNIPHELHFPRLEKLALYFKTPEHI